MLKLIGNISMGSMRRHVKFGGIPSSRVGDIIGFSKSKMAAQAAILDLVQRSKLIGNISVASVRRRAKFGRNRSSRPGDIEDFNKSKMAAILDPVQMLKLIGNISVVLYFTVVSA